MKKGHLSRNIFIIIFSSTILLLMLVSFYMASLNKNNIKKQQILKNKSLNEQISLKIDSFIFKQQIVLETFIDNFVNSAEDITDQNKKLNYFVSNMNYINDIVVLDSTGGQKAYFGPYYKIDYRDILNKIKQNS